MQSRNDFALAMINSQTPTWTRGYQVGYDGLMRNVLHVVGNKDVTVGPCVTSTTTYHGNGNRVHTQETRLI